MRRTRRCQNRGSAAIFCEVIYQKPNPLLGSRYEMGPCRARFTLFHDMYKLVGHDRLNKKLVWKQFSMEVHTISMSYPAHIVINFDLSSQKYSCVIRAAIRQIASSPQSTNPKRDSPYSKHMLIGYSRRLLLNIVVLASKTWMLL